MEVKGEGEEGERIERRREQERSKERIKQKKGGQYITVPSAKYCKEILQKTTSQLILRVVLLPIGGSG